MRFTEPHGMPDRPWMFSPTGGVRYTCPFECGWHHDELAVTRWTIPAGGTIDDAINEGVQRRAADTEAAIAEHLHEHTARVMLSEEPPPDSA